MWTSYTLQSALLQLRQVQHSEQKLLRSRQHDDRRDAGAHQRYGKNPTPNVCCYVFLSLAVTLHSQRFIVRLLAFLLQLHKVHPGLSTKRQAVLEHFWVSRGICETFPRANWLGFRFSFPNVPLNKLLLDWNFVQSACPVWTLSILKQMERRWKLGKQRGRVRLGYTYTHNSLADTLSGFSVMCFPFGFLFIFPFYLG